MSAGRERRYGAPAIALHWLIALLVFAGYGLGLFMQPLPVSPQKLQYYSWHKWIGVTVFWLALLRAAWRVTHPAPPLSDAPAWQRRVAQATHGLLYLLLFAIPLSGWLHSSAAGYQTVYLGVLPLPDLVGKNAALSERLGELHEWLNYGLLALLVLHAAAALKHAWIDRDDVLASMLPRRAAGAWSALASGLAVVALGALAALLLLGGEAGPSQEAPAPVSSASGEIVAQFRQMGVAVEGHFTSFRSQIAFDPEQPSDSHARIEVDTASFDLGDADYNREVRKPEWLDSAAQPVAVYSAGALQPLGGERFEAIGQLSLKGRTQPLRVPFTVRATADGGREFSGETTISRTAFGIGDASWNDVLDDAVTVRFRLLVPPG